MKSALLAIALLSIVVAPAYAQDPVEAARIEYLITSVNALQGAKFIRNGSEYDARAASGHLRRKLKIAGDRVKTAEDFIAYCASKSSISGEPYEIRLTDGTTMRAEAFFRSKLKEFATNHTLHKSLNVQELQSP